jgi:hypothetical protein
LNKEDSKEDGFNPLFGRKVNNYNENDLKKEMGLGVYENKGSGRPLSSKPVERSRTPVVGGTPLLKKEPILPDYDPYKPKINGIVSPYKS